MSPVIPPNIVTASWILSPLAGVGAVEVLSGKYRLGFRWILFRIWPPYARTELDRDQGIFFSSSYKHTGKSRPLQPVFHLILKVMLQVISKIPCHSEGALLRDRRVSYFQCQRSFAPLRITFLRQVVVSCLNREDHEAHQAKTVCLGALSVLRGSLFLSPSMPGVEQAPASQRCTFA